MKKKLNIASNSIIHDMDYHVDGPGDCFQIDATVCDIYLVSQFDRRRIVGRPMIHFLVDTWSRLIVGIHVGLEGATWNGAMMAFVNTVTPKTEFCKQYGIEISESDWPSHYAPKRIKGDFSVLMSAPLWQNIVQHLRIEIENARSSRGDQKSLVESVFGIISSKFRTITPGYVEKDFKARGVDDYRLGAALNLHEFAQMIIYTVLEHNAGPIRHETLPTDMMTEGLTATPNNLWQWGVANRSGCLKKTTLGEVVINVMPSEQARVTQHGIRLKKDVYYSCATAVQDEWFSKARSQQWNVTISYDPQNIECAYILDPKLPQGYEACNILDRSFNYRGKSIFEIEKLGLVRKQSETLTVSYRRTKHIKSDECKPVINSKKMNRLGGIS